MTATSRSRVAGLLLAAWFLALPVNAAAQAQPPDAEGQRKSGTYLKLGLGHWQGNIFNEGSLTQWTVDLFGAQYHLTSVLVEVESHFGRAVPVSGFRIGYRKDALRYIDSGHMVNGMLFWSADLKVFALKTGGGIEWGVPSLNFDQTEFDFADNGTVRYRHTYPGRNAYVPFVGTKTNAAVYPFIEVSAFQRPGHLLLEAGMRINIVKFHFDDYEVSPADEVTHAFSRRRMLMPYLFANLGVRLF